MKKREIFKVEGDKINRQRKHCPKCGDGVYLAEHKNRSSCGSCGYTEFKGGGKKTPEKPIKTPEVQSIDSKGISNSAEEKPKEEIIETKKHEESNVKEITEDNKPEDSPSTKEPSTDKIDNHLEEKKSDETEKKSEK